MKGSLAFAEAVAPVAAGYVICRYGLPGTAADFLKGLV